MNIFSNSNCKDDCDRLKSVILKCGNSGSAIILQGTSSTTVFPIITINTSHLDDPCTTLLFTCNIVSINLIGTINFQLYRLCSDQAQPITIGPQWSYTRSINPVHISTFSFFVEDCDLCSGEKCKYAVVASPVDGNVGDVIINNATLSAIAASDSKSKSCLESCPILLNVGTTNTTVIPVTSIIGTTTISSVASVAVNTSSLCNPDLRFEFTSNLIVPVASQAASVNLIFQVFRNCANEVQPIPVGPQWTFLSVDPTSEMFTFFVCDCTACAMECCTYTVQVTVSILNLNRGGGGAAPPRSGNITISNATLSVFGV